MAESILLALGLQNQGFGGWNEGQTVIRSFLKDLVGWSHFDLSNGSGLFGKTAFSARNLSSLLLYMHDQTQGQFKSVLPHIKQGTLKRRLKGMPSRSFYGKTGTLDGVSTLSGYLTTREGQSLTVSILMNHLAVKAWRARSIQDEMIQFIWLFKPTPKKRKPTTPKSQNPSVNPSADSKPPQ